MNLKILPIYESAPSVSYPSFFQNSDEIQACIKTICEKWRSYLEEYVKQTDLVFKTGSELPWENTERAIVSTLAASIIRSFDGSVLMEELSVDKNGNQGRCDLWASIPSLNNRKTPFSFYLEAKKSSRKTGVRNASAYLKSDRGVSRVVNDYVKGNPARITKLSSYRKERERQHEHYVIGMLIIRLMQVEGIELNIGETLRGAFETRLSIALKRKRTEDVSIRKRRMGRFPTVAMAIFPDDKRRPGMLASFTVFGSTDSLMRKRVNEPPDS